jgi:hypothetical protein
MPARFTPVPAQSFFNAEADQEPELAQSERRCLSRLAEFLLLNRLRARTRGDLVADMLERAAIVIEVTSRHWLAASASAVFCSVAHEKVAQAAQDLPVDQALGGEAAPAPSGPAADQLA